MTPETGMLRGADANALAYDRWSATSAGEPRASVLFMHGGGQTRHAWDEAARRFAEAGLTATTVDARGHGGSEWVASQRYSILDMGADLNAVVEQVGQREGRAPILVGASMGGLATMIDVFDHGSSAYAGIVFVDITPRMQQSGVDRILGFMAERAHDGFATIEEAADAIAAYLPERARPKALDGLAKNLRQRASGRYHWHWDPAFVTGPHAVEGDTSDGRQEALIEGVRRIDCPLLLVRGSRSELVSPEAVAEFRSLAPHSRFVDVRGAGHMVAGDKNDVFADAVLDFIETDILSSR